MLRSWPRRALLHPPMPGRSAINGRVSSGLRPTPPPRLAAERMQVRRYQGLVCWTPVTQKCGRKPSPKNSQNVRQIIHKIIKDGSRQEPRGTQNQEKGVLGGTLGSSWGALGTQMGPRCEKDDFFGLSPPSLDPYFFTFSIFFVVFFTLF